MTRAYLKGCFRVGRLISMNSSFRGIVSKKVTPALKVFETSGHGGEERHSLASSFADYLVKSISRVRVYNVSYSDVVSFGKTNNNLREFKFFCDLLREHNIKFSDARFLNDFVASRRKVYTSRSYIELISQETRNYILEESGIFPEHLYQNLQYASTYISIMMTYQKNKNKLPLLAVVANDHSPSQVGFTMAMEDLGVPTIYLQHAEVADTFPPLDYSVSILRNQISKDIYTKLGPIKGKVFVLSRNLNANFAGTLRAADRPTVGIYPTSRFEVSSLKRVVELLSQNSELSDYFVKLHPNSATVLTSEEKEEFRVVDSSPALPHVAIVGNSSVVTELLGQGIPVYQLFELDEVTPDYYGFVSAGLTPEIVCADLATPFWKQDFYCQNWVKQAARFEPTATTDQKLARQDVAAYIGEMLRTQRRKRGPLKALTSKKIAKLAFERLVFAVGTRYPQRLHQIGNLMIRAAAAASRKRDSRKQNITLPNVPTLSIEGDQEQAIELLMDQAEDRLALANALLAEQNPPSMRLGLISWFEKRWATRDVRAYNLLRQQVRKGNKSSDPWLRLQVYDILAFPLDDASALLAIQQIKSICHTVIRKKYENLAMRVLIKNGYADYLFDLLRDSPVNSISMLGSNFKVEIARYISNNVDFVDKELFISSLSEYERLKIYAAGVKSIDPVANFSHIELEDKFLRSVSSGVSLDFRELVKPVYDRLRERMQYANIRVDSSQRIDLQTRILTAIKDSTPFSLIRLGDGEAYLFPGEQFPFNEADRQMRERHWWDRSLEPAIRDRIVRNSLSAISTADIVGIPTIHRFFRDFSGSEKELLLSTANRGVVTSLLGAAKYVSPKAFLTEDRAHHILFTPEDIKSYIEAAPRVVIISSIKAERVTEALRASTEIETIEIPTHAKTKSNPFYVDHIDPLPFVISDIEEELSQKLRPGDLVFVSAGVAGKSLVGIAKQKGAVGLDLGGMVEVFVGVPNGPIF